MTPQKAELLLRKYAPELKALSRELAMNFDVPSRDLIQMACYEMRISQKQWEQLKSYEIARDEGRLCSNS